MPLPKVKEAWNSIFGLKVCAREIASLLLLNPIEAVTAALEAGVHRDELKAVFEKLFPHEEMTAANILTKTSAIMLPSWRFPTELKGLVRLHISEGVDQVRTAAAELSA